MLFNSIDFLIFFPIVVLVYFIIPSKLKNTWLLFSSYYFYMCWNAKYALLILTSTLITYTSGLVLEEIKKSKKDLLYKTKLKKIVVLVSFASNLGILFYFKYINFAFEIISDLFARMHIQLNVPFFDIILPVGISFYTFQALSYTMDVYRDDIYAEKNFIRYALFVSFFPQLVAGPIERSKNLLKQLSVPHKFNFFNMREGFFLMLWGYFLKLVLADRIAIFVDAVYRDYKTYSGMYIVIATLLFSVQIYCDFAGYSTIAQGAAKVLGIQLMENFNAPYLSSSTSEFWRKWHISLTSWFKDYLYIPLGGGRKGKIRKYINKLIVFLISGLWHGADLSFVVWGAINGIYQIVEEIFQPAKRKINQILMLNEDSLGYKGVHIISTFLMIDFSWIFFRADNLKEAINIIKSMIIVRNPWILFDGSLYTCGLDEKNFRLMLICVLVLLASDYFKTRGIVVREVVFKQDYWFRWLFVSVSIVFILTFGIWGPNYSEANFLYFQF